MARHGLRRPSPSNRRRPNTARSSTKPTFIHYQQKSPPRVIYTPTIIHGEVKALNALSPDVEQTMQDYVAGRIEGVGKVGHEMIKPTGGKFVFVLRTGEEKEKEEEMEIDEEAMMGLVEYINGTGDEDEVEVEEKVHRFKLVTKANDRVVLQVIEHVDLAKKAPVVKKYSMEVLPAIEEVEESSTDISLLDEVRSIALHGELAQSVTATATINHNAVSLSKLKKTDTDHHHLPRTSNGPSLASLIARAKASDFDPEPLSSNPTLSIPAPKDIGLRHSSKGPSLAALIASADPKDFPLPDSDPKHDPIVVSVFIKPQDVIGSLVHRLDHPHDHAFTVLRERFEARHEGGSGGGANAWARKKNQVRKESCLRTEVQCDGGGEDQQEVTEIKPKKFKVKRREQGAWWIDETFESPSGTHEIDGGCDGALVGAAEPLTKAALDNHIAMALPPLLPSTRTIRIRYASMNDVWGEISSLSTTDSTMSKSSSAKTTETAATEYSQLIEALDLPGLLLQAIGEDVHATELHSSGVMSSPHVASSQAEHGAHRVDIDISRNDQDVKAKAKVKQQKKGRKPSPCARLLGKFSGKAKTIPDKVVESTKKVGRKLRAIFRCA